MENHYFKLILNNIKYKGGNKEETEDSINYFTDKQKIKGLYITKF